MSWIEPLLRFLGLARDAAARDRQDEKKLKRLRDEAKTAGQIADEGEAAAKAIREVHRDHRP